MEVLRPEHVRALARFPPIAIVGGAGAGKSTLAIQLSLHINLRDTYEAVDRLSTRQPRVHDHDTRSVSDDTFDAAAANGRFFLSWERPLADGSSIKYGCLRPAEGRVPLLVAGHGIYSNSASVMPTGVLEGILLVGLSASPETRATRVTRRDRVENVEVDHDDELMRRNVDVLIETDTLPPGDVADALVQFLIAGSV